MKFEVVATEFFIEQIENLDGIYKEQIKEKIKLISANPFRFEVDTNRVTLGAPFLVTGHHSTLFRQTNWDLSHLTKTPILSGLKTSS